MLTLIRNGWQQSLVSVQVFHEAENPLKVQGTQRSEK